MHFLVLEFQGPIKRNMVLGASFSLRLWFWEGMQWAFDHLGADLLVSSPTSDVILASFPLGGKLPQGFSPNNIPFKMG